MKKRYNFYGIVVLVFAIITVLGCYRKELSDDFEYSPILYFKRINVIYIPHEGPDPEFMVGDYGNLLERIYENLSYPEQALVNGSEGLVSLYFAIKPDGTVDEVIIKTDIGDGCGEAAVDAVLKALDGIPYKPTGEVSNVYGLLEIYFEIA